MNLRILQLSMALSAMFHDNTTSSRLLISFLASFFVYGVYKLATFIHGELTSPLRDLPGPPSQSFIYGNFKQIWESEDSAIYQQWEEEYGSTLKYTGILGRKRFYTSDLKALNHIITNNYDYHKPEAAIYNLRNLIGSGVLLVEDDVHKQQRKIMNPAFGPQQIRELTEIFVDKSIQLRDLWTAEISKAENKGVGKIDALHWLSRMTLDVIGLAGFNYKFDALTNDPEKNELNSVLSVMFKSGMKLSVIPILRGIYPFLRFLPAQGDAEAKVAGKTMFRIGAELLREGKASIKEQMADSKLFGSRDLLSILLRANMKSDLPESQRLSDEDVLSQIPTFLLAGHETTSIATTWALYALTQHQDIQSELRKELLSVSTDIPTMDELNGLPYLDAVVRETLRLYAPVPGTIRVAEKDDFLPLSEPFKDRKGKIHNEIKVSKGQMLTIPIVAINKSKKLWGEDAGKFKPTRWENVPEKVSAIPGIWSNMLTFLGGPRACIGYRLSIIEMKALLFTLVRAFEFELEVSAKDIKKKSIVIQRPEVVVNGEQVHRMPLLVRPIVQ